MCSSAGLTRTWATPSTLGWQSMRRRCRSSAGATVLCCVSAWYTTPGSKTRSRTTHKILRWLGITLVRVPWQWTNVTAHSVCCDSVPWGRKTTASFARCPWKCPGKLRTVTVLPIGKPV
ncbi:hypothetical protein DAEQUDRAFT_387737 [Daedalea quercina L-15889]|uniref:Uncharacterized protein n=1 Tax=Daedalea quercina L-15889 TaxID=1314783 RepID=A0A165NY49_9APHY|nr:hypothetical protein DAEQUDRAFT_387737 [Daedalea quercina L-15889]